ncbi:hypothetical protein HY251_01900 [bacterium]|nr:hypothetical protein [bacterium]
MTRGSATFGILLLSLLLLHAKGAGAQDRGPDPENDRLGKGGRTGAESAETPPKPAPRPVLPYDPNDEAPPPDAPGPSREKPGSEERGKHDETPTTGGMFEGIETKADGRIRLELGYDSNVFRAERGRTSDFFFHGYGEGNLLVRFPGERELFASVTGEGLAYGKQDLANEAYGSSFADYYHPLTSRLDVEVQNTFEYSRQNLLDDNGDLLPREKFNAYDEECRVAFIAHATDELSFEIGGGFRWKDFEETFGIPSLDFYEARGNAGARFKIPWWPESKLRVRYVFRERHYLQLRANLRDGAFVREDPKLVLQRHQAIVSYSQRVEIPSPFSKNPMQLSVVAGYTFTYNGDIFENDRSYREHSGSLRVEWWIVREWTRLELEVRGGTRSFLVRRAPSQAGLRQRFLDSSALLWQKVYDHVAIVGEVAWFLYDSTDPTESYGRFVGQLGIEVFF